MDKNYIKIKSLHDKSNDFNFWLKKSYEERLKAIEFLRQQYIKYKYDFQPRLQRVIRIVKMK